MVGLRIKATQRGLNALSLNLNTLYNIAAYELLASIHEKLGITKDEWEQVQSGYRLLSTDEFYHLLDVFMPIQYHYHGKTFMDWLLSPPNFGLVGILQPEYYLESDSGDTKCRFQCFAECPCAIIDDPDVEVYEGGILVHDTGRQQQRFIVKNVYASPRVNPHEPAYKLQVERWRPSVAKSVTDSTTQSIQGKVSISIGNLTIGDNSKFSGLGDVFNHSAMNTSDVFDEARKLVETLQSDNKQNILEAIEIMERAKASGDKSEGKRGLEKFLDLAGKGADVFQTVTSTFKQWFLG